MWSLPSAGNSPTPLSGMGAAIVTVLGPLNEGMKNAPGMAVLSVMLSIQIMYMFMYFYSCTILLLLVTHLMQPLLATAELIIRDQNCLVISNFIFHLLELGKNSIAFASFGFLSTLCASSFPTHVSASSR